MRKLCGAIFAVAVSAVFVVHGEANQVGEAMPRTHVSAYADIEIAGIDPFDGHDFMFVWTGQKGLCERDHIQPHVPRETKQPVVQVESVDINNSLFLHLFKRQGLDSRPALHRIAEAQRSVSNPSRGSVDIVPNISACRKGPWYAGPEDNAVCIKDGCARLKIIEKDGQLKSPQLQTGGLLWDIPQERHGIWFFPPREPARHLRHRMRQ